MRFPGCDDPVCLVGNVEMVTLMSKNLERSIDLARKMERILSKKKSHEATDQSRSSKINSDGGLVFDLSCVCYLLQLCGAS